jgi:acyl-CoA thioester hydrolase
MKGYEYDLIPRFSDFDKFGIVYHSNYLEYLEEARINFMNEFLRISLDNLFEAGIKVYIVSLGIKYKKSINKMEIIKIFNRFIIKKNIKITVDFNIVDMKNNIIAAGSYDMVLVDDKNNLYVEYPEIIKENIKYIKNINGYTDFINIENFDL